MARGVNKVILIGNLGADPETRYTASGSAVCNVRMATSRSWRDRNTNEMREETEWHRVVLFGRLGEIAGEYLRKGARIYIEGRIRTNQWKDQQGQDRYTTEIVAEEMQMLDTRSGDAGGPRPQRQSGYQGSAGNNPGTSQGGQGGGQAPAYDAPPPNDSFEDDIPF